MYMKRWGGTAIVMNMGSGRMVDVRWLLEFYENVLSIPFIHLQNRWSRLVYVVGWLFYENALSTPFMHL